MNQSVLRAVGLLEALAKREKPMSLRDLAAATHLDKATAYRLLGSLAAKGMVDKPGGNGLYALGPAFLFYAEIFKKTLTIREKVLPHLERLAETTEETAIYCERFKQDSCVTIERWDSPHETRTFSQTGIPRPLYAGSSGQAILAVLPDREIEAVLKKGLTRYTPHTPSSREKLLRKIKEIRRKGYAVSMQEQSLYSGGIAAPVFNDRTVIGSLAVVGPLERLVRGGMEELGRKIRETANKFSCELGHVTGRPAPFQQRA
jgi:DNA-binding IclR family transcriptional regulator